MSGRNDGPWTPHSARPGTLEGYLRRKLDPLGPSLIHTQRGVGYSLREPVE